MLQDSWTRLTVGGHTSPAQRDLDGSMTMKVRQAAKRRTCDRARYRITYSPDFDHEAWQSPAAPTPQTHPDAFHMHREVVNPRRVWRATRKTPHATLSIGAMKKRLYRAGIAGKRAAEIAREIHAGPERDPGMFGGYGLMGWPVRDLERRYGKRVTRAVRRFVRSPFVLLDETWMFMEDNGIDLFSTQEFQRVRKYGSAAVGHEVFSTFDNSMRAR